MKKLIYSTILATIAIVISGCASTTPPYDYTAYRKSAPKSILVLPPKNSSVEPRASNVVLETTVQPLAEAGYYVIPTTLANRILRENGVPEPAMAHDVSAKKLREIFGADAALYITVNNFGTKFLLFGSVTEVAASARLVDLRDGALLWEGQAAANSEEGNNQQGGGILGMLLTAVIKQVAAAAFDPSPGISSLMSARLLSPKPNGLLYGPRHPDYGKDAAK